MPTRASLAGGLDARGWCSVGALSSCGCICAFASNIALSRGMMSCYRRFAFSGNGNGNDGNRTLRNVVDSRGMSLTHGGGGGWLSEWATHTHGTVHSCYLYKMHAFENVSVYGLEKSPTDSAWYISYLKNLKGWVRLKGR